MPDHDQPDQDLLDLARAIDARCRLHGEFMLRSGTVAREYFDKYLFEGDPVLLHRVAQRMVALLPTSADVVGGLELGGVPLATMVSSMSGLPAVFVRKEAKRYGTRRLAEGGDVAGREVLLIEDVITTGGAVRAAAAALRGLGAIVTTVVCAIDRSDLGSQPLTEYGLAVRSVLTKNLLDSA